MSEIKLNLVDAQQVLCGIVHGSIGDALVAALTAEPETIPELKLALTRYQKQLTSEDPIHWFSKCDEIDERPWDAGLMVIDLVARIIVTESTYSHPGHQGEVNYHDGQQSTDIVLPYRLAGNWLFLRSFEEYGPASRERRAGKATLPPLDTRAVLYGPPLMEFIASEIAHISPVMEVTGEFRPAAWPGSDAPNDQADHLSRQLSAIHALWLMTPRVDLRGQAPREVMLAQQDLIDFDLHTRELQWSFLGEGPPCLPLDSAAFRFAGFGTHEWVIYYDLVRYLLRSAGEMSAATRIDEKVMAAHLNQLKTDWLEQPQADYGGRIPAITIENERRRLPLAMLGRDLVLDDDCPMCRMMADDADFGSEVGFWHLDGAEMDDDFVFSSFLTLEEWEADRRRWKEFNENFEREWAERKAHEARKQAVPEFDRAF